MPDHFHRILMIVDDCNYTGAHSCGRGNQLSGHVGFAGGHAGPPVCVGKNTVPLGRMIHWFKTMTTNEYIRNVHTEEWRSFNKKIWQRNYFDPIIRGERELHQYREYINNNPMAWEIDQENI